MAFSISELTFGDSSLAEQRRTRKVFEALVTSAKTNKALTEHEKEFLFTCLSLSQLNDGPPEQYSQCDNPKFKWLFLVYLQDITGGSKYVKPSIGKGQSSSGKLREVSISEAQADLKYLIDKAEEFDRIIFQNHSDQLLMETAIETRRELLNLDLQQEFLSDPYFRGRFYYRYKRWSTLIKKQMAFSLVSRNFRDAKQHSVRFSY